MEVHSQKITQVTWNTPGFRFFCSATFTVFCVGVAWGQTNSTFKDVEENKHGIEKLQQQVNEVKTDANKTAVVVGKIDERTKGTQKDVAEIKRSIERIADRLARPPS